MTSKTQETMKEENKWPVGLRVMDEDGHLGTIINSEDLHNVEVVYDNGGQGMFCLDPDCEDNEIGDVKPVQSEVQPQQAGEEKREGFYCKATVGGGESCKEHCGFCDPYVLQSQLSTLTAKNAKLKEALKTTRVKLLDAFGVFGGGNKLNDVFDHINKTLGE